MEINFVFVIILVIFSALFSGLGIGLFSLSNTELKRKASLGNEEAKKVYDVRKNGNLLLCTLLLGNVIVNSSISIILGDLTSGFLAGLLATGLIFIFGELVPQAVCTRYALMIGARTVWLIKIFMFLFYPVCWPLAWVLDKFLGKELSTIWPREEIMKIIEEHASSVDSDIDSDEKRIVFGALSFSNKIASDIMTPRTVVFALDIDASLNKKNLEKIRKIGFTRIPVFEKTMDNIVGIILVKDLIGLSIKERKKVRDFYRKEKLVVARNNIKLDALLNVLIQKRVHLAIILNEFGGFEGLVSLEDIIEEIFLTELMDEKDSQADLRMVAKKKYLKNFRSKILT